MRWLSALAIAVSTTGQAIQELPRSQDRNLQLAFTQAEMFRVSGNKCIDSASNCALEEGPIVRIRQLKGQRNADHMNRVAHRVQELIHGSRIECEPRPT